jgi:hypothetical protein
MIRKELLGGAGRAILSHGDPTKRIEYIDPRGSGVRTSVEYRRGGRGHYLVQDDPDNNRWRRSLGTWRVDARAVEAFNYSRVRWGAWIDGARERVADPQMLKGPLDREEFPGDVQKAATSK